MCWYLLFVNAVLAIQFPIAERTHGYDIKLSPFLMARLAGIIMLVYFLGRYILKGLSTALIPIATNKETRIDKTKYVRIIGTLIYLMIYTRLDIIFTLEKLS